MQGKRGALPSSTIMLRQPMQRFQQMQASDIDIYRNELRKTKNEIVSLWRSCMLHLHHLGILSANSGLKEDVHEGTSQGKAWETS